MKINFVILLSSFFLFQTPILYSQSNPITWTVQQIRLDKNNYIFHFSTEVDSGWYFYGDHENNFPRPLRIQFALSEGLNLLEGLISSTVPSMEQAVFQGKNIKIPYYKENVSFTQRVSITPNQGKPYIGGQFRYRAFLNKNNNHSTCLCFYSDFLQEEDTVIINDLSDCNSTTDFCLPKEVTDIRRPSSSKVKYPQDSKDFAKWNFHYRQLSDNQFQLIAKAQVRKGYRLITDQDSSNIFGFKMSPLKLQNAVLNPAVQISIDTQKAYYSIWEKELKYGTEEVQFTYNVSIKNNYGQSFAIMKMRYMVCDENNCSFPSEEIIKFLFKYGRTIHIGKNKRLESTYRIATKVKEE